MARDRQFQAILPLRGKILNVERGDDEKMYANNEISNLIIGLGLGLKGDSIKSLRYGKVHLPFPATPPSLPRAHAPQMGWCRGGGGGLAQQVPTADW